MFLRVTAAILCSIIIFKYVQSKRNSGHSSQKFANEEAEENKHEEQEDEEEEEGSCMKTINMVSSCESFHKNELILISSLDTKLIDNSEEEEEDEGSCMKTIDLVSSCESYHKNELLLISSPDTKRIDNSGEEEEENEDSCMKTIDLVSSCESYHKNELLLISSPDTKRIDNSGEDEEEEAEDEGEGSCMKTIDLVSNCESFHKNELLLISSPDTKRIHDSLMHAADSNVIDVLKHQSEPDCNLHIEFDGAESATIKDEILQILQDLENSTHKGDNSTVSQQKESEPETELRNEQRDSNMEFEWQFYLKNLEIDHLNAQIVTLQDQVMKLSEELQGKENVEDELDLARQKIKELHETICGVANQKKAQLSILMEQVAELQERERNISKMDSEMEMKLQRLKELEIEVVGLRRTNKELHFQKRDLMNRLDLVERTSTQFSGMSENNLITKMQAEASRLQLENADLIKQVEMLQMNGLDEGEELVYLRWINACLRHELKSYKSSLGNLAVVELNKSSSPRSMEKAKQLMVEYAGYELDCDGISSLPSASPEHGMDLMDHTSIDSSVVKRRNPRTSGFIGKWRKWIQSKTHSLNLAPLESTNPQLGGILSQQHVTADIGGVLQTFYTQFRFENDTCNK